MCQSQVHCKHGVGSLLLLHLINNIKDNHPKLRGFVARTNAVLIM